MTQKKKRLARIVWLALALVVALAAVAYWQRNNLMAIRYAMQYDVTEQEKLGKEADAVIQNISDEVSGVDFAALPEEALQMLEEGSLSEEEAVEILTGKTTWETLKQQKTTGTVSQTGISSPQSSEEKIDSIIAKVYVLRSSYTGKLDALVGQAKADYRAKKGTKAELSAKYIGIGSALEGECDAKIENLLSELQTELQKTGGELSLVNKIRSAYQREKSLKKAALISKYKK